MATISKFFDLEQGRLRRVGGSIAFSASQNQAELKVGLKIVEFVIVSPNGSGQIVSAMPTTDNDGTVKFSASAAGASMSYVAYGRGR